MKRPDFDVIVAGAGAGGAAAAYYLTQAGLKVLVVERARLPRYKACGGAIPQPTLERVPLDFSSVIRAAPTGVRFLLAGRMPMDVPLAAQSVVMVMRSEFDAFLLSCSKAEVLEGTTVSSVAEDSEQVRVEMGERTLTARFLVGADGATSQVARSLGLRQTKRLGATVEAEIPITDNGAALTKYSSRALFSLVAIPWGYAWVFPKGDHLSVGIGRFRPGRIDLKAALKSTITQLGINLGDVGVHGHPIPVYHAPPWPLWRNQPQERLSTRRCLLVGDAAGLVDPLVGEGIHYAITSARLAAEAIERGDLTGYEEAIWQEIGHSLATAGLAAHLFYRMPALSYELGVRNPAAIRRLIDVITGKCSYQGIGRRLIAAQFHWVRGQFAARN
jgi:geranylgeranyl reductase family protein